jgi:DNA-binding NtrC family response regulator
VNPGKNQSDNLMKGKKILIVDDEQPYRVFMRKLFERHGCKVETTASGLVSLEIANQDTPDVLIIDWMLKNSIDGLQVAAELRKLNPDLVTILITGYPSAELQEKTKEVPRTLFMYKPFDTEDLLTVVQAALEEDRQDS